MMPQTTRACPNCKTPLPAYAAFCYACGAATPPGIDKHTGEFVVPETTGVTMSDLLPRLRALLGPAYDLGARIGAGGFAEVFLARDLRLKREVAVKVTRPELALNAQMLQRFRREAETIAALRHPHIMPIYDIGEGEGIAYIVMPYVHGESLKTRLDRVGRMPVERARQVLLQVADALAAAHEAGVIHRDVKPDNVMLDRREDHVLLMDFGIAKAVEGEITGGGLALTSTGLVMGTPHYMSPEQAAGERQLDARADQYSLAVVGYRMLSGVLPFDGATVRAVLASQLVGALTPLAQRAPEVPQALAATIERGLAKEPADRFPTMREFIDAMRADPSYATEMLRITGSVAPYVPGRGRGGRSKTVVAAVAALVIGGAVAVSLLSGDGASGSTDAAGGPGATPPSEVAAGADAGATPNAPPPASSAGTVAAGAVAAGTADSAGAPDSAAARLADSSARQLRRDSALARRVGLTLGTAEGDSFVARVARDRRSSCEARYAAGRYDAARPVCEAAARLGRTSAARTLGNLAEREGRWPDAVAAYALAAPRDAQSALRLSTLLAEGRGAAADPARSAALLREAADSGLALAQRTLADRLSRGTVGVRRDERAAVEWYGRAAEKGDVPSMMSLAYAYQNGRGVRKGDDQAAVWWARAGALGDSAAQYRLGMAYLRGRGVPKSDSMALDWHRRAAAQGHSGSRFELEKRGVRVP